MQRCGGFSSSNLSATQTEKLIKTVEMEEVDSEKEALRLKSIAESKFANSNLKSALKHAKKAHRLCPTLDGLASMLAAFKILRVASTTDSSTPTDWYKVLQVEPFSHINTIKKQYKKLALILHPDKNTFSGCEDAFKLVGEGFRVLSDKIRRKEYDMRLRIRLQEERVNENSSLVVETFWTACSRCRLLHQFERRYLGHNLICPSCKKSFEAVEVEEEDKSVDGVRVRSERLRQKLANRRGNVSDAEGIGGLKGKGSNLQGEMGSGEEVDGMDLRKKAGGAAVVGEKVRTVNLERDEGGAGVWGGGRLRTAALRRKTSTVEEVLEKSKSKRVKFGDEEMTLAEMQLEAKKKANKEKAKLKEKQKFVEERERKIEEKKKKHEMMTKNKDVDMEKSGRTEKRIIGVSKKSSNLENERQVASTKTAILKAEVHRGSRRDSMEIMAVEDSEFYDFDRDRVERSFKKGQVWAIYDDDDGMPRHYGLIDEVISVNPFLVELSWLDLLSNEDERLISWERTGGSVSCGKYKVAKKAMINSLNIFSHAVECERAAREIYRIYPKKGSVWALYSDTDSGADGRNLSAGDKKCYDILVVLSTYSEVHGLSTAYLEKVDGFKTIFRRREIGCHAIRLLEKDDVRLFSHQIPARKLSGSDIPDILKDCWELDPASLHSELLSIGN